MKQRLRSAYHTLCDEYPIVKRFLLRYRNMDVPALALKRIRGRSNIIAGRRAVMADVSLDIEGNNNRIEIGENALIRGLQFFIRGDNHRILIGRDCRFHHGGEIWFEDNDCVLEIGEGSTFERVHLAVTEPGSKIVIGKDCMFARDIDVRTGDSHSIVDVGTGERINFAEDVQIADHVWVASHCAILKGVHLPDNTIVANGSIVTKKFSESGTLIAGSPAKVVRQGVTWRRERIYRS